MGAKNSDASQVKQNLPEMVKNYEHNPTETALAQLVAAVENEIAKPLEDFPNDTPLTPINPVLEPQRFRSHFAKYGVVVGNELISEEVARYGALRAQQMIAELSDLNLSEPATWANDIVDGNGTDLLARGFLEIYHDDGLAQVRQSVPAWVAGCLMWERTDLLTTFDRYAIKMPHRSGLSPLPLHLDQNPNLDEGFSCLQGLIALIDNPESVGCFQVVPGSKNRFLEWVENGRQYDDYLPLEDEIGESSLRSETHNVPLHVGQGVFWDSRTVHASTEATTEFATSNFPTANKVRLVALVATAPPCDDTAMRIRKEHFVTAGGMNHREARMHASFRPRYENPEKLNSVRKKENLTPLGERLYFGW